MYKILASTENLPYEDWLEYRRLGLGGSDASVVCGINRWKSPVELWAEKTGAIPNQEAGEAAYWGTFLEPFVRAEFIKRTGIVISLANQILQSETNPFMLANLDGICEHPEFGTCIFEAKTTSAYRSGEWEDTIPDDYMLQIHHYMAVTGFKGAYIAVLVGGNCFKWYFVERDEELITFLIKIEADFWGCVQLNTPPVLDGSDAAAKFLNNRFPESVPQSKIELPTTAIELIEQYDTAAEKVKLHTEQKQEAENRLKQMLGSNETGIIENKIVTWKTSVQERLDSKTLKAEHPTLCAKYANKITNRRFSIKEAI